jgi:hypothetical protein
MSDLFAWFQGYLSLSKTTAVTVPGMVEAFADSGARTNSMQENKNYPFCPDSLTPVTAKSDSTVAGASAESAVSPSGDSSSSDTSGGTSCDALAQRLSFHVDGRWSSRTNVDFDNDFSFGSMAIIKPLRMVSK